jgi:hypothetical protein
VNPRCPHCGGTLIVGACQLQDGCCQHDLTCPAHGRQYVQSVALVNGECPDARAALAALPLFAGLEAGA